MYKYFRWSVIFLQSRYVDIKEEEDKYPFSFGDVVMDNIGAISEQLDIKRTK